MGLLRFSDVFRFPETSARYLRLIAPERIARRTVANASAVRAIISAPEVPLSRRWMSPPSIGLLTDIGGFRKSHHDGIHHGAAFPGPQWMTRHPARFVDDDESGVLEQNLEVDIRIAFDREERRRRLDLDIVARVNDRALDAAPPVQQYCSARHHLARIAARGRMTGAHQIVVESFGARFTQ